MIHDRSQEMKRDGEKVQVDVLLLRKQEMARGFWFHSRCHNFISRTSWNQMSWKPAHWWTVRQAISGWVSYQWTPLSPYTTRVNM